MAFAAGAFSAGAAGAELVAVGGMAAYDGDALFQPVYDTTSGFTSDITVNGRIFRAAGGSLGVSKLLLSSATTALAALTATDTDTGAAADNGVFTTAAPVANMSSLPSNFGPGRGNWTLQHAFRVTASIRQSRNNVGATTNTGGPVIRGIALVGSDIQISIKNMCQVALADIKLDLTYTHSIRP